VRAGHELVSSAKTSASSAVVSRGSGGVERARSSTPSRPLKFPASGTRSPSIAAVANQRIGLSAAVGVQTTGNNLHPGNLTLFAVGSFPVSKCVIFVQISEKFAFGVTVSVYDMAG